MRSQQETDNKEPAERVAFSNRINKKIIKTIRIIAAEEEKDLYLILEEALEKYIKEKGKKI